MSEEQTTSTEQSTSTTATEPTLEQVYQEFKVDDVARTFQPQRETQTQTPQPSAEPSLHAAIPDPILDAQGFKTWLATQSQTTQQALTELKALHRQQAVAEFQKREEADIKTAVSKVKEKVGDVDDDFIEVALGAKARKDQRFQAIWQNRNKNPQAWNAALNAVANEFKGKFQFRQDSQLTENVRAAKQSTQTSLTTKEAGGNSLEQRFEGKSGRDFDREWERLTSSSY